ncbi:hypothetical protein BGZ58_004583 [Dissophora ornata]|nr:hypothetical protein BGZ58_004583 [Dissophora ornata]
MNEGVGEEGDEETARRTKEQRRKERRLRKEQKMQRHQEKERRIQLPLLVVCVPSGKSKRHRVATGEETTMVEIKIPHQEGLSIISDTEILAGLGLNESGSGRTACDAPAGYVGQCSIYYEDDR